MRTSDFHFHLPTELIAHEPCPERDQSRLLVVDRQSGGFQHRTFRDLPRLLNPGDLLVRNSSKVIPARLRGRKTPGSAQVELLLLEQVAAEVWWVMLKPGKRIQPGHSILLRLPPGLVCEGLVLQKDETGRYLLQFSGDLPVLEAAERFGEMPLPPYIERDDPDSSLDRERYQTVYAQQPGSVAAPTAGLHFTSALIAQLTEAGIAFADLTLHVGHGTFAPVKADALEDHQMHAEWYACPAATAASIIQTRQNGNRAVAVGTTATRVLESIAARHGQIVPDEGKTSIFVYPPYQFKAVDALITNFHLPQSTLLMLVSAFAAPGSLRGRDLILEAYQEAIRHQYRFFSYGDAMLIL